MALAPTTADGPAERDAVAGLAVAVSSGLAFLLLVALPAHADDAASAGAGPLGFVLGAVIAPVAAGVAAYASAATLRTRWAGLTRRVRRLHVTTIVASTLLLVGYVASSGALRTWLD